MIIHLFGDAHQPLHVGYLEDKGGNTYQVSSLDNGTNLHKVWDSEIIDDESISLQSCLATAEQFKNSTEAQDISVMDWLRESRLLTADCYPACHKIDKQYLDAKAPIVERQIALAGLRLAAMLHTLVKPIELGEDSYVPATKPLTITVNQVNDHIEDLVQVCGKVYGVKYLKSSGTKPTFVNIGAAYPNSPLTLFIPQDVRDSFSYKPEGKLDGQNICLTGTLQMYKGKPEIIIHKESDISLK